MKMMAEGSAEHNLTESLAERDEKRFRLSNGQILLIVLIVLGIQMVVGFSQRIVEGQRKYEELSRIQADVALLEAERRQLETEKTYYSSSAYINNWAHAEGKMIQQGEVLVIPLYDPDALPEEGELPVFSDSGVEADEPAYPPFHYWWALFFASAPPNSDN